MRLTLILLSLLLGGCRTVTPAAATCPKHVRAIFDVGSGTTKLNVSEVAVCGDGRVELLRTLDEAGALSVSLEAAKDTNGVISAAGITELSQAIELLKSRALSVARERTRAASVDFAAAGTHAVRTAKNFIALAAALQRLGVPLERLTQAEEAAIGLASTRGRDLACEDRPRVVWDVGGGSQQFTAADGSFRGLGLGAEGFKSRVIKAFPAARAPGCEAKGATANPLGASHVAPALALAESLARCDGAFCDLRNACVIGVGGLHARAIDQTLRRWWPEVAPCVCPGQTCAPQANGYTRAQVECLAEVLSTKDDCDSGLRGPYSTMGETNVILVAGFMRALHVDTVHIVDVNMGQGLALDSTRLRFQTQPIPR